MKNFLKKQNRIASKVEKLPSLIFSTQVLVSTQENKKENDIYNALYNELLIYANIDIKIYDTLLLSINEIKSSMFSKLYLVDYSLTEKEEIK